MTKDFTSIRREMRPCCSGTSDDGGQAYRAALQSHRATRSQTLAMVGQLSQSQMDYRPASNAWSVGEVLDHLILGQRLNLCFIAEVIEMKKAGLRPTRKLSFADVDVSIGHIPKNLLPALEAPFTILNMFMPAAIRDFLTSHKLVPAQNPSLTTPRPARPADDLRGELVASSKEMDTLLESHAYLNYCEMVIEHPLIGNNNVPGLVRFLALHEQRHQTQMNNIMKSPRFPGRT